jgi:hypothetical protein
MASATLTAGVAIGFAAATNAAPNNSTLSDYADCVLEHPDKVGHETCCIFYGGTWDESNYLYECSLDRGEAPKSRLTPGVAGSLSELTVDPGPASPTKGPELTTQTPVISRG